MHFELSLEKANQYLRPRLQRVRCEDLLLVARRGVDDDCKCVDERDKRDAAHLAFLAAQCEQPLAEQLAMRGSLLIGRSAAVHLQLKKLLGGLGEGESVRGCERGRESLFIQSRAVHLEHGLQTDGGEELEAVDAMYDDRVDGGGGGLGRLGRDRADFEEPCGSTHLVHGRTTLAAPRSQKNERKHWWLTLIVLSWLVRESARRKAESLEEGVDGRHARPLADGVRRRLVREEHAADREDCPELLRHVHDARDELIEDWMIGGPI